MLFIRSQRFHSMFYLPYTVLQKVLLEIIFAAKNIFTILMKIELPRCNSQSSQKGKI